MAWTRLYSGSEPGNISMNVDYNIVSATRTSNTNVRVVYGIRFSMTGDTYTYNSVCAFTPSGGTRRYAFNSNSGSNHTVKGTYYYANTTGKTTTSEVSPFTQDITVTVTQTSAKFSVGYGWHGWTPNERKSSEITVTFPTGATAPSGLSCSVSNVTETSCKLSGSYSSNGNATVTTSGYQYKKDGGSWTNCTATVTGLSPLTKYYFRYYATNSQGTSYSDGTTNTTTYDYPKPTSITNFIIGNGAKVNVYNPLGRTYTLEIVNDLTGASLGSYSGNYQGEINAEFKTTDAINKQYASIPNGRNSVYHAKVTYGSSVKISPVGTYEIKGTETPTFETSNIINVVDTLHVNDITGNNTKVIKGHNKITGSITKMTANYSSSGNKYVVNANATPSTQTINYDNGATKSFTFDNLTTNSFSVTAYDTRELFVIRTKNVDLVDYSAPKINEFTVTRLNGLGEYMNINAHGSITYWSGWSGIKKYNSVQKVYIRYKVSTATSYGSWQDVTGLLTTNANGSWKLSGTLDTAFDVTKKYDFQMYITDVLESSSTSSSQLSTANGFLWRDLANKRLGINKKPERTLDVNGDIGCTALYIDGVKVIWKE